MRKKKKNGENEVCLVSYLFVYAGVLSYFIYSIYSGSHWFRTSRTVI